jgi:hypothetical protein
MMMKRHNTRFAALAALLLLLAPVSVFADGPGCIKVGQYWICPDVDPEPSCIVIGGYTICP